MTNGGSEKIGGVYCELADNEESVQTPGAADKAQTLE